MTLEVPFEEFAKAAKRLTVGRVAFVTTEGSGTRVTAADPLRGIRVVAHGALSIKSAEEKLRADGFEVEHGRWIPDEAQAGESEPHVVAVAYRTSGTQPGLWVDAFPNTPTPVQAIRALYDEFSSTGEIAEVPFEEFVRLAEPTVVIVSPSELRSFAASKDC